MPLEQYRKKRDFSKTPEPRGAKARVDTRGMFVIQKHAASRLHYDFRLELDGVLLSWAVPKGPSLDPGEKRLAVHVEDHPVEYGDFEGIIPKGQYGGGTVLLWDRGHWIPEGDPRAGYAKGHLKFRLEGDKLHGGWALVQMHGERSENGKNWLLIKEKDATAEPGSDGRVVEEQPKSVASRRTIEEVASTPDRVWQSHRSEPVKKPRSSRAAGTKRALRGKAALPATIEPELATLVDEAPAGDAWVHEIKYDGYRILCRIDEGEVTLLSRNGKDWTAPFASVATAVRAIPARRALLDGEVVMLEPNGTTSFQALQNALKGGRGGELTYIVFDLLHLDGVDLRGLPLEERKRQLDELLAPLAKRGGTVRVSEHVEGNGPAFLAEACRYRLEGIVSKRADSPYRAGRGRDWLKIKCSLGQEFVIGGFTEPSGARSGFGALLVGYYDAKKKLQYAGKVGTGFSEATLDDLHKRLVKLELKEPAFVNPPKGYSARGFHYTKPELVAEVRFTEWTNDGQLRHPAFLGLREDKDPKTVTREEAVESRPAAPRPATARRAPAKKAPADESTVAGVKLTHPDRVMYAEQGITKLELARFYEFIAPFIMPHLTGRPLSIVRCPEGHEKTCFFQKHANETTARAVGHVMIEEGGKTQPYLMVDTVAGLVSLIQMGALELHVWGAPGDDVEHPDRVVFDLDPGPGLGWSDVIEGTLKVKATLESIGLRSFLKTSGGKGLHVVVPFKGKRPDWDTTKAFAHAVADRIAREEPSRYVVNMSKAKRQGRIFIDYLRNGRGATTICAYSTRARDNAPVSVPIGWDELSERVRPDTWNVRNLPARLAKLKQDPWRELATVRQTLTASARKTLGL